MKPKRCHYCGDFFQPDPRASFQKACPKPSCRQARKQQSQRQWVRENPDYFQGRYANTKLWLAGRPGYLRDYRAEHPEYVASDNRKRGERKRRRRLQADIQDAIPRREIALLSTLRGADIQDTIRLRLDGLITVLGRPLRADIQDSMALP